MKRIFLLSLIVLLQSVGSLSSQSWTNVGGYLSSSGVDYNSIAFDSFGNVFVACMDYDEMTPSIKRFDGSSWQTITPFGIFGDWGFYTSLAFAPNGDLYLAFQDWSHSGGLNVIKYDGTVWSQVGEAYSAAGQTAYCNIAIDPTGVPYVVFQENLNKASVLRFVGGAWQYVGGAGISTGRAFFTSISMNSAGIPYIVYRDEGLTDKAVVRAFIGGSWTTIGGAPASSGTAYYTAIKIAPNGDPYISYRDASVAGKASVQKFSAGSWSYVGAQGFSPAGSEYNALEIDSRGTPYVMFADYSVGQKASVMKFENDTWSYVGTAGFSIGRSYHNAIGISPSGAIYTFYRDDGVGSLGRVKKMLLPPLVETQAVLNIQTTMASFLGAISKNGGAPVLVHGFCWNTSGTPEYPTAAHNEVDGDESSFTFQPTDLTGNTVYHVRAYATNAAGVGYGNEISFTTIPTLGEWGLIAFGSLIAAIGCIVVWKRFA